MSASTMPATLAESVVVMGTPGSELVGVLTKPADQAATKEVGVVIVVGGPQTRVGSHRQFVLMARAIGQAGYPCLRFDYTGMGDSPGPRPHFERAGQDLRRACNALLAEAPNCTKLALWGLCDGASAAIFYSEFDERIAAVIAANPWVRSEATRSAALLTRHYRSRLLSPEFWKKLSSGRVRIVDAAREAIGHLRRSGAQRDSFGSVSAGDDLVRRLAKALAANFDRVRLQLSGRDLTAAEFEIAMGRVGLLKPGAVATLRLEEADHTFSDASAWELVVADTIAQLGSI